MIDATIVTTCKGRLHHLRQTFPLFVATGLPVVVVDYDDPDFCGNWVDVQKASGMPWEVTVVRHINQEFFNPSHARNSGAAAVRTEWIVFLDADRIIGEDFIPSLAQVCKRGQMSLHGRWTQNFNGITIVRKEDHDAVGGWPIIARQNYGMEDTMYAMLLTKERSLKVIPWPGFLDHIQHDDDLRTKHYPVKDLPTGHADNIATFNNLYGDRLK